MLKISLLAAASSLPINVVTAQYVSLYGQCAGLNFAGPYECQPPYACVYANDWFSQCLKWDGTQSTVAPPRSSSAQSSIKPTTTVSPTIKPTTYSSSSIKPTATTSVKPTTTSLSSDKPPPSSPIPASSSTSRSIPPTTSTTSTRPGVSTTSTGPTATSTKPTTTSTTSTKLTTTTKPTSTSTSTRPTTSTKTCSTSTTTTSRRPIPTIIWPIYVPLDGTRFTKFELNELPSGRANVAKTGIEGSFEVARPIPGSGPIICWPWPLDPCNPRIRYLTLEEAYPFSYKPVVWTDDPKTNYWVVPEKGLVSTSPDSPYKEVSTFLACGPDGELYLQTGDDAPTDLDCEKIVLEYDGE